MKDEQHDPVWHLLERAKKPAPSPFFARNVLRRLRERQQPASQPAPRRLGLLLRLRTALLAGAAVVALAVYVSVDRSTQPGELASAPETSPVETTDYDVISDLDELLASQDSIIWLDSPAAY